MAISDCFSISYLITHPDLMFMLNVTGNRSLDPEHVPSRVALGMVSHSCLFVLNMIAFLKWKGTTRVS